MRMFIMSVIVLAALGFGLYRCEPARTYVRNVLIGSAEETGKKQPMARAVAPAGDAEREAEAEPVEAGVGTSPAQ